MADTYPSIIFHPSTNATSSASENDRSSVGAISYTLQILPHSLLLREDSDTKCMEMGKETVIHSTGASILFVTVIDTVILNTNFKRMII